MRESKFESIPYFAQFTCRKSSTRAHHHNVTHSKLWQFHHVSPYASNQHLLPRVYFFNFGITKGPSFWHFFCSSCSFHDIWIRWNFRNHQVSIWNQAFQVRNINLCKLNIYYQVWTTKFSKLNTDVQGGQLQTTLDLPLEYCHHRRSYSWPGIQLHIV